MAFRFLVLGILMVVSRTAAATYLDDIGFTALLNIVPGIANGSNVIPVLNEASTVDPSDPPVYFPDPNTNQLSATSIVDVTSQNTAANISSHATTMAIRLAGTSAMTPGISSVLVYEANDFINSVLIDPSTLVPRANSPVQGVAPLANHSWVGDFEELSTDILVLQRFDWLVDIDNMVNVVGVSGANPIASNAFNVIAVRNTSNAAAVGTENIDSTYVPGRVNPVLVAPLPNPSQATAVASSAAALLMDAVYPTELPAELVKAALLAGADRTVVQNTDQSSITDYRADATVQATNGMDTRYGAGQLNIQNSYSIITGGASASSEDGGVPLVGNGYHYDAHFGGAAGSNAIATYAFTSTNGPIEFTAALVWHVFIEDDNGSFLPVPELKDLNLRLIEKTAGGDLVRAESLSTLDNTENLWLVLPEGRDYELQVTANEMNTFDRDYALAWHFAPLAPAIEVPNLPHWSFHLVLTALLLGSARGHVRSPR